MAEPKYETHEARIIGDAMWYWLKRPCGECHIPPGTGCDICGAEEPPARGVTPARRFTGVGHLEETGYIPEGSAAEREGAAGVALPSTTLPMVRCTECDWAGPATAAASGCPRCGAPVSGVALPDGGQR